MPALITVAAAKGGVGKTTLAYELAAALEAVLVDLDWDAGGATRMWGFDPTSAARAPLLDALERGPDSDRVPRLKRRVNRPTLFPSHPDLAASAISADLVADCLETWATQWDEAVVVDTHPGANELTDGAIAVADLLLVPVTLGNREFAALDAMLDDFSAYRMMLVPTMVPTVPARRQVNRLAAMAKGRARVAPPISEHRWIRRRLRRAAIVKQPNPGVNVNRAAAEFRAVAEAVREELS
ncbi:MAG: ParA family protein [Planctomycetota bacterium]|nr:ParA family protein [Planctomycetota bacterium]